jgi:hypothetical protein
MKVSLADEIAAIRINCNQQWEKGPYYFGLATKSQSTSLFPLFRDALEDTSREMRLAVISEFTGRPIPSSRMLTNHEAHTLIEELVDKSAEKWSLSQHGRELIAEAECAVRTRTAGAYDTQQAGSDRRKTALPNLHNSTSSAGAHGDVYPSVGNGGSADEERLLVLELCGI